MHLSQVSTRMEADYANLAFALRSPLPNDQDLGVSIATLLCNETKHVLRVVERPSLLDDLLAHAGIFNHCSTRECLHESYLGARNLNLLKFWDSVLSKSEIRLLLCEKFFYRFRCYLNPDEQIADYELEENDKCPENDLMEVDVDEEKENENAAAVEVNEARDFKTNEAPQDAALSNTDNSSESSRGDANNENSKEAYAGLCCVLCPCNEWIAMEEAIAETLLDSKTSETTQDSNDCLTFAPIYEGSVDDKVGQRVLQIAHILRNLSFEDENANIMAKNETLLRFLLIGSDSSWKNLMQLTLDIVGNISPHLRLLQLQKDPLSHMLFNLILGGLGSDDRFRIIRCLEAVKGLATGRNNDEVIFENVTNENYRRLFELLSISDIMLLVYTLEALLSLSSLGEKVVSQMLNVAGSVSTLVSLLTVEAQSYGPKGCIQMRVVETVSGATPVCHKVAGSAITESYGTDGNRSQIYQSQSLSNTQAALPSFRSKGVFLEHSSGSTDGVGMDEKRRFQINSILKNSASVMNHLNNANVSMSSSSPVQNGSIQYGQAPSSFTTTPQKSKAIVTSEPNKTPPSSLGRDSVVRKQLFKNTSSPGSENVDVDEVRRQEEWLEEWLRRFFEFDPHGTSIEQGKCYRMYSDARRDQPKVLSMSRFTKMIVKVFGSGVGPVIKPYLGDKKFLHGLRLKMSNPIYSVFSLENQANLAMQNATAINPTVGVFTPSQNEASKSGEAAQSGSRERTKSPILKATLSRPPKGKSQSPKKRPCKDENGSVGVDEERGISCGSPPASVSHSSSAVRSLLASKVAERQQKKMEEQLAQENGDDGGKSVNCSLQASTQQAQADKEIKVSAGSSNELDLNGGGSVSRDRLLDDPLKMLFHCNGVENKETQSNPNVNAYCSSVDSRTCHSIEGSTSDALSSTSASSATNNSNQNTNSNSSSDLLEKFNEISDLIVISPEQLGLKRSPVKGNNETVDAPPAKKAHTNADQSESKQLDVVGVIETANSIDMNGQGVKENSTKELSSLAANGATTNHVNAGYSSSNLVLDQSASNKIKSTDLVMTTPSTADVVEEMDSSKDAAMQVGQKASFMSGNLVVPIAACGSGLVKPETTVPGGSVNTTPLTLPITSKALLLVKQPISKLPLKAFNIEPLKVPTISSNAGNADTSPTKMTSLVENVECTSGNATANGNTGIQSSDLQNGLPVSKSTNIEGQNQGVRHVPCAVTVDSLYLCEWKNCSKFFKSANKLFYHAVKTHAPECLNEEVLCQWGANGCDNLPRKKFSLITHLQDRHCSKMALEVANYRRKNNIERPACPPSRSQHAAGFAPNAALHAIKRHAVQSTNAKDTLEENEGPVTKSIRLTAALILRNLASHSYAARKILRGYESHLCTIAMGNVESSRTLSQLLFDLQQD